MQRIWKRLCFSPNQSADQYLGMNILLLNKPRLQNNKNLPKLIINLLRDSTLLHPEHFGKISLFFPEEGWARRIKTKVYISINSLHVDTNYTAYYWMEEFKFRLREEGNHWTLIHPITDDAHRYPTPSDPQLCRQDIRGNPITGNCTGPNNGGGALWRNLFLINPPFWMKHKSLW